MRQYTSFFSLLASTPLFHGYAEESLEAMIGDAAAPALYKRGDTVFGKRHGMPSLGFVVCGALLVYKQSAEGRRLLMSRLSPGQAFGMASLFSTEPYPTEIQAETTCQVVTLPRAWVEAAFQREPGLALRYIALLSERIHFLNRRIDALSGDDVRQRLLAVLSGLYAGGGEILLPFPLAQMAELTGMSRASLYRTLDALAAEGIIAREGRRLAVLRPEVLSAPTP